jgi:hypothetical protein
VKCPAPTGVIEEVNELMKASPSLLGQWDLLVSRLRNNNGPINKEGAAKDILPRYETPEAAVHTIRPVVAHHKIISRGYDYFPITYVVA